MDWILRLSPALTIHSSILPWLLLFLPAALILLRDNRSANATCLLPALAWAAVSWFTGDRELYFACSLSLATALMLTEHGRAAGPGTLWAIALMAEFMMIRYLQQATGQVLLTESLSAVAILVFAAVAARLSGPGTASRLYVILLSSLLSCWTLAI